MIKPMEPYISNQFFSIFNNDDIVSRSSNSEKLSLMTFLVIRNQSLNNSVGGQLQLYFDHSEILYDKINGTMLDNSKNLTTEMEMVNTIRQYQYLLKCVKLVWEHVFGFCHKVFFKQDKTTKNLGLNWQENTRIARDWTGTL